MYCSNCGKEISNDSKFCYNCGYQLKDNAENCSNQIQQEIQDVNKQSKNLPNQKKKYNFTKIITYICRIFFVFAFCVEADCVFGHLKSPLLFIGSLFSALCYLLLTFVFSKEHIETKFAIKSLLVSEAIYIIGLIINSFSIKNLIGFLIMGFCSIMTWIAILLKINGKPLKIFDKLKVLYILLPLIKPIVFAILIGGISGTLMWAISAIATALAGFIIGFNVVSDSDSDENKIVRFYNKSWFAGYMLIVFFPLGLYFACKNKHFKKPIRIIASIITGINFTFWFLFFIVLLIPCDHDWNAATCTEPQICNICGKSDGKPLGHTESDWSEWDIDYDKVKATQQKTCTKCETVIDSKEKEVNSFISNGKFTIYPHAFAKRFENSSSRLKNIDYYAKSETEYDSYTFDEDNSIYYRIQDKNNDYKDVGLVSFSKEDHTTISATDDFTENCAHYINILVEDSSDVSAVVYASVLAIDPIIDYDEAAEIGQEIVDSIAIRVGDVDLEEFKGINHNGINYLLYKDRKYHYLVISPQ